MGVLLGMVVVWLFAMLSSVLKYPEALSHLSLLGPRLWVPTWDALLRILQYLLMLLMLASRPMRVLWGESRPPGLAGEAAEKVLRLFPRALSSLAGFLGVYFLLWAVRDLPAIINISLGSQYDSVQQHFQWLSQLGYLYVPAFGIVGLLLLLRPAWGRLAGLILLPCLILLDGVEGCIYFMVIFGQGGMTSIGAQDVLMALWILLAMLPSTVVYAVLAWFLWRMPVEDRP